MAPQARVHATRSNTLCRAPAPLIFRYAFLSCEFLQMRSHGVCGCRVQVFWNVEIDLPHNRAYVQRSIDEGVKNLALAQLTVGDVFANLLLGLANHGTMRRINSPDVELEQTAQ